MSTLEPVWFEPVQAETTKRGGLKPVWFIAHVVRASLTCVLVIVWLQSNQTVQVSMTLYLDL